ncbi:hypothetical protein [Rhodoferax sp.]|uniref:hypothetical protein n=1 Tax=Rhodoferax sp. TaxID=50421 RepID=UPI00374D9711
MKALNQDGDVVGAISLTVENLSNGRWLPKCSFFYHLGDPGGKPSRVLIPGPDFKTQEEAQRAALAAARSFLAMEYPEVLGLRST